jgi:hypothetical protein
MVQLNLDLKTIKQEAHNEQTARNAYKQLEKIGW